MKARVTRRDFLNGYSDAPDLLWEPACASEAAKPCVRGRQPLGRISIAKLSMRS